VARLISIAIAYLALAGSLVRGAEPAPPPPAGVAARIEGPDSAVVGDLVILDASHSEGADFAWVAVGANKGFLPVDSGRRFVFATAQPGKYTFILAVGGGDQVATDTHELTIEAPLPPGPGPGPGPSPTPPDPALPDGKFALAKLARDWALSIDRESPLRRRQTAQSLAGSFRSIASAIAAGTLSNAESILEETRSANNRALGDQVDAWKPWGARLADTLTSLHRDGRLRTTSDYVTAWTEIAQGLEAVR
jgi:hypothetical protein